MRFSLNCHRDSPIVSASPRDAHLGVSSSRSAYKPCLWRGDFSPPLVLVKYFKVMFLTIFNSTSVSFYKDQRVSFSPSSCLVFLLGTLMCSFMSEYHLSFPNRPCLYSGQDRPSGSSVTLVPGVQLSALAQCP